MSSGRGRDGGREPKLGRAQSTLLAVVMVEGFIGWFFSYESQVFPPSGELTAFHPLRCFLSLPSNMKLEFVELAVQTAQFDASEGKPWEQK